MAEHKYRLSYRLDPLDPPLGKEEVIKRQEEGFGACDAMLVASIIYPEDGSYSLQFMSQDGRTGEDLTDLEMFKVWSMLSSRLAQSATLDPGRKMLCRVTFETIRDAILGARRVDDEDEIDDDDAEEEDDD